MNTKSSYKEHLNDPRWIKRRNGILSRDNNTCQFCGAQDRRLHVHHRAYFEGCMPWEYPDKMLVTLCEDCHREIHQKKDETLGVEIGQVYTMYHSDFENTCIVYHIDYEKELIYTLECDDGAGYDSIYDTISTFEDFHRRYTLRGKEVEDNVWFGLWLKYVSEHLEETTLRFQYRWEEILRYNPILSTIIKNTTLD